MCLIVVGANIDSDVGPSKYRQLVRMLREKILAGGFDVDEPLPSERSLIRSTGLSRITVQHALSELARSGLVERRRGSGTFVTRQAANRELAIVVPGIVPYAEFFQPIVSTIARLAQVKGYRLFDYNAYSPDPDTRQREVVDFVARLIRRRVAGVIFVPLEFVTDTEPANMRILKAFARARIPVVLLDSDVTMPPLRSGHDLVTIDNVDAGARLAQHLFDEGARDVCFMRGPSISPNVQKRIQGVTCAVVARTGCWTDANVLVADPADRAAVRRFLRRRRTVDAFVCDCDVTAARLLQTLDALGIAVPRRIRLAGIDDVKIAALTSPPLTTIHQPCEALARAAFERLETRIRTPDVSPVEIVLEAPLVVRASSVPARCPMKKAKNRSRGVARLSKPKNGS